MKHVGTWFLSPTTKPKMYIRNKKPLHFEQSYMETNKFAFSNYKENILAKLKDIR